MATEVPLVPSPSERACKLSARFQTILVPVEIGVMAAFLAFERLPRGTRRTLWAEDGTLFLHDAMRGQYDVFAVYAGYLHVIPRAAALAVVSMLELPRYAVATNISACMFTGLVATVVYIGAEDVIPGEVARVWLALMTVLCPVLGVEVLANLANLHTVMMWGAFWALWRHPRTLGGALALACFELLAALTEVQSVILVPLALLALWRNRTLRQALVAAGLALGAAGQALAASSHERASFPHLLSFSEVAQLLGLEVAMPLWLVNTGRIQSLIETYGWWVAAVATLPLFVGFTLALRHGSTSQRGAAVAAAGMGVLIFCMSHMLNAAVMGGPGYSVLYQAPVLYRYAVAPSLFFLALVPMGVAAAAHKGSRLARGLGIGSLVALLIGPVLYFRVEENSRDPTTSWNKQLREARAACRGDSSREHVFSVSPPPWAVALPCSSFAEAR